MPFFLAHCGSGTAKTVAGGNVTAFNDMSSAGGLGSGMSTGTADGTINVSSGYAANSDSASTGSFSGNGSGSYDDASNQPYLGGSVNGNGSGAGQLSVYQRVMPLQLQRWWIWFC
jgi:hypothetical protein